MPAALLRNQGIPLYHQLKTMLREQIREGLLQPGQRLPSEDRLAASYHVSLITVRRALADLAAEGLLRRIQGRGTFVAQPALSQGPRELTSFSEEMRRRGLEAASRVLEQSVVEADEEVAGALDLPIGGAVLRLRRLRLAGSEPMGLQTAHVSLALAPGLEKENFERASLYEILSLRYGIVPARAREVHAAASLTPAQARLLGQSRGAAALAVTRTTWDREGRPFELVHSLMRGDRYQVVLELFSREV